MSAGHYFDENPGAESAPVGIDVALPDRTLEFTSDRGVFSATRLDAGTKFLLLEAPWPAPGTTVLDLGCGWGPIAVVTALRVPDAVVWAVDVNPRARALTERNAARLGVADRVRVVGPDEVPSETVFDRILSNPPIRIGKAELHDLLRRWLARLAPDGAAHLVVQKHLGSDSLARWLTENGCPTSRRASRAGYRILDVGAHADEAR